MSCHAVLTFEDAAHAMQEAELPFEELIRLQQEGVPVSQLAHTGKPTQQKKHSGHSTARTFRRENKNRPVEQSSKRAVPRHRQVVETKLP